MLLDIIEWTEKNRHHNSQYIRNYGKTELLPPLLPKLSRLDLDLLLDLDIDILSPKQKRIYILACLDQDYPVD